MTTFEANPASPGGEWCAICGAHIRYHSGGIAYVCVDTVIGEPPQAHKHPSRNAPQRDRASAIKRVKMMEPSGELTADLVRDVLSLVLAASEVPDLRLITRCTKMELGILYDWAIREHLHASDNVQIRRRSRPFLIEVLGDLDAHAPKSPT